MKIVNRKQAKAINWKQVYCFSKSVKYFIITDTGWLTFRTKREALQYIEHFKREA